MRSCWPISRAIRRPSLGSLTPRPSCLPTARRAHPGKDLREDDKQAGSAGPNYRLVVDAVKGPIVPKVEGGPPGEQERHGLLGRRAVIKLLRQAQGQSKLRRGSAKSPSKWAPSRVRRATSMRPIGVSTARPWPAGRSQLPLHRHLRRSQRRSQGRAGAAHAGHRAARPQPRTKEKLTGVGGDAVVHLDQTEIAGDVGALDWLRSERLGLREQYRRPLDSAPNDAFSAAAITRCTRWRSFDVSAAARSRPTRRRRSHSAPRPLCSLVKFLRDREVGSDGCGGVVPRPAIDFRLAVEHARQRPVGDVAPRERSAAVDG